jgi:pyruvate formate-lyase activating enzyme-like uncharacterized protein
MSLRPASASIEGSTRAAREVVEWAVNSLTRLSVHFCSARYKDAIQLRNRLERRLEQTIRDFEERDDTDPLLVLGVIRARHGSSLTIQQLKHIHGVLSNQFGVPNNLINADTVRMRIELAPGLLEELAEEIKTSLENIGELEIGISYEYPTWDRLQIQFDPV